MIFPKLIFLEDLNVILNYYEKTQILIFNFDLPEPTKFLLYIYFLLIIIFFKKNIYILLGKMQY